MNLTRSPRRTRAHTLTEMMVGMAIVLLVMAGVLSAHVFGLRLFEVTKTKLGASDDARVAIGLMVTEIRSAKLIRVGNGSAGSFVEAPLDTPQQGNAVQIHPSSSPTNFVRYYRDPADQKLKRQPDAGPATVVASAITNALVFTAEDFSGTILTNNENNRVIGLTLQFCQLEYPSVAIGPGNLYDFYQLRTKITRRTLE